MNTYNFVTVNAEIVELSKLIVAVSDKDSSVSITFGARKSADDKLEAIVKVLSSKSTLIGGFGYVTYICSLLCCKSAAEFPEVCQDLLLCDLVFLRTYLCASTSSYSLAV